MEIWKKKQQRHLYRPWSPDYGVLGDAEEQESWVSYIHRSLHRQLGEGSPFPDSEWSYMHEEESPFEGEKKSDSAIHYEVLDAFYTDPDVDASDISVIVHNGVVHLSGAVKDQKEKTLAEKTVRGIAGVWRVENELSIEKNRKKFVMFS